MAEIDDELIARALRWCAEAGRPADALELREALAPLSWDELLAARALLADPPPARPLGPRALADLARGVSPDEAAARERAGGSAPAVPANPPPDVGAAPERRRRRDTSPARGSAPVVRRARDRVPPAPPAAPRRAAFDALHASEGRAVLERLVREHRARRGPILAALAGGWAHPDGRAPSPADLDALLEEHGLARAFAARERDELLHALRAAAGARGRAAAASGLAPEAFDAALERLGARAEAEAVRAHHREELRRRTLLSDRARLVLSQAERLADLGLEEEFLADLRRRLPEHLRALRAGDRGDLAGALGRSLSLQPGEAERLAERAGVKLEARRERPRTAPASPRPAGRGGARRPAVARKGPAARRPAGKPPRR